MKSPHVEIQDFDNDGWPDVYTSIVKFAADGQPHPVIFRGLGLKDGLPTFRTDALAVNDFPTAEEQKLGDVGPFFAKMQKDHRIVYTAPGPSGDYNRDGKLDLFLANWWVDDRSLSSKMRRRGHWLDIAVKDKGQPPGIGGGQIYPPASSGSASLLGQRKSPSAMATLPGRRRLPIWTQNSKVRCRSDHRWEGKFEKKM
jgi:hypothetical protein